MNMGKDIPTAMICQVDDAPYSTGFTGMSGRGSIHSYGGRGDLVHSSTAATVLLGTLFPALFTATTRYSRFIPRG